MNKAIEPPPLDAVAESVALLKGKEKEPVGSRGKGSPVVRALASYPCGLGLITARCHMCVEFVVGSPYSEGLSRLSGFSPS